MKRPYHCANCRKKTEIENDRELPLDWFEVVSLQENPDTGKISRLHRHFCSVSCLLNWVAGVENGGVEL